MTLTPFEELLREGAPDLRTHLVAKLLRQAKPDDVFQFIALDDIRLLWPELESKLGRKRGFWAWWMERWGGGLRHA